MSKFWMKNQVLEKWKLKWKMMILKHLKSWALKKELEAFCREMKKAWKTVSAACTFFLRVLCVGCVYKYFWSKLQTQFILILNLQSIDIKNVVALHT